MECDKKGENGVAEREQRILRKLIKVVGNLVIKVEDMVVDSRRTGCVLCLSVWWQRIAWLRQSFWETTAVSVFVSRLLAKEVNQPGLHSADVRCIECTYRLLKFLEIIVGL